MNILLLGSGGQLGIDLHKSLSNIGTVIAFDRKKGDLLDTQSLVNNFNIIKPDIIVNAAAYTAVDRAEDEKDIALKINSESLESISSYCFENDILLVHFSTDYVFDGKSESPILEIDQTKPINFYGHTKLLGDLVVVNSGCKHLIFRISWVFSPHGNNFPNTILNLCSERKKLRIVNDQFGSPTSTHFIANVVSRCIHKKMVEGIGDLGIYNLTPRGTTNWFDFAVKIIRHAESKGKSFLCPSNKIEPISSDQFPTKAKRPNYSKLSTQKIENDYLIDINHWSFYYEKLF